MKELYNEFFYVPKHGKIRDKVMLIRTAVTAIIMIVCLAAMSLTAYAYFSYNVTSGSNIIKAANFEANVSIIITDSDNKDVDITKDGKLQTANLTAGTYTVELTKGESTADTGFCIVTIGDRTYHTAQIGEDVARNLTDASVTFTLKVAADTKITILSHWGTSSFYGYKDLDNRFYIKAEGCEIDLTTATNSNEEPPNEEQNSTGETTPTEVIHTVAENETLSTIAEKYGVSVEQIAAYNELADPNSIQAGQQLKIPSADYVVPADTTEQSTTTPETTTTTETTAPAETTSPPETTTSAETTAPSETTVTDPAETTAPAETTTSTEPAGSTETSAPAETTEPVETTSDETKATETTAASTDNAE